MATAPWPGRAESQKAMAQRKVATRAEDPRRARGNKLKDEVYRQMFRLEANRPGADLDLAIALLRGWVTPCPEPEQNQLREWLEKVCTICLLVIEAARQREDTGLRCVQ
jgi:hypothetical protein